jgi:hypothetical protein
MDSKIKANASKIKHFHFQRFRCKVLHEVHIPTSLRGRDWKYQEREELAHGENKVFKQRQIRWCWFVKLDFKSANSKKKTEHSLMPSILMRSSYGTNAHNKVYFPNLKSQQETSKITKPLLASSIAHTNPTCLLLYTNWIT